MAKHLQEWHRLMCEMKAGVSLTEPKRLVALEHFRGQLISVCGEEPTVAMALGGSVRDPEDFIDVPLADYLGWFLGVKHAVLYCWENGSFRNLAAFGRQQISELSPESLLAKWIFERGSLLRSKLTLEDLSAAEAEMLFRELDILDASVAVPIVLNEGLWGLSILGPPMVGGYNGSEELYLSLYGLKTMSLLETKRKGLPSPEQIRRRQEEKALQETMEMWAAFRPQKSPLRLLLVDEECEVIKSLQRFFSQSGFEVLTATSESQAIELVEKANPHVLLVDLHLNWRFPKKLLDAAREIVPHAVVLATTTVSRGHDSWEDLLREAGVQGILRKPCRFSVLARDIFDAGVHVALSAVPSRIGHSQRCLIVEDEPDAAMAVKEYLEFLGYRTWTAGTGKEGLALAARVRPQAIFLDLGLPDIDGRELLQKFRTISPNSKVAVVTARVDDYPLDSLKAPAPDAYCAKPASVSDLRRLADQILSRQ